MTKPIHTLRARLEGLLVREVSKQLQPVIEGVQDLIQTTKDSLWKSHLVQVWSGFQENDRESELDSGQI